MVTSYRVDTSKVGTSNYTVIAYYTKDTPYETEIHSLRKSCAQFGLEYHFRWYENRGSWEKNCSIKPEFILYMMEELKGDCLYVDADATIEQYPEYFDTFDGDIGVHFKDGVELLSGTIYLRYNTKVLELLKDWVYHQRENSTQWDQKTLQWLITQHPVKVVDIPPQYTQIFDDMAHHGDPVIQHNQASRRFKDAVLLRL